jgi:hypothetical protein
MIFEEDSMRCEPACVTLVVLLAAQVAFADPLVPDSPLGCPPFENGDG